MPEPEDRAPDDIDPTRALRAAIDGLVRQSVQKQLSFAGVQQTPAAPPASNEAPRRGPGRPKKVVEVAPVVKAPTGNPPRRGPGRPKKVVEVAPVPAKRAAELVPTTTKHATITKPEPITGEIVLSLAPSEASAKRAKEDRNPNALQMWQLPILTPPPTPKSNAPLRERVLHLLEWKTGGNVAWISEQLGASKNAVADIVLDLFRKHEIVNLKGYVPPRGRQDEEKLYWGPHWVKRLPLELLVPRQRDARRFFLIRLMMSAPCTNGDLLRATGMTPAAMQADVTEIRRHMPVWDYAEGPNNVYSIERDLRYPPLGSKNDGTLPMPGEGGRARRKRAGKGGALAGQ